jgi:hypothetical protein
MTTRKFEAILLRPEGTGTWTLFMVPSEMSKEFGTRARVRVRGTIDDLPYKGTLLPNGEGLHFMVVKKEIRDAIGKTAGDEVNVTVQIDSAPRSVTIPEDLQLALEGNAKANAAFNGLAHGHKKEYVDWIEQAKKKETREDRISRALQTILERRKVKG